jgi:capsular exopolysaccharide synthesis family protein
MHSQPPSGGPSSYPYSGYPSAQPASVANEMGMGGLGMSQVFGVLRHRWWLVLLFAGLSLAAGWHLVPQDKVVHRATATVRLDDARRSLTGSLSQEADNVSAPDYMTSQIHVLQSRSVVGEVVDSTGFRLSPSPDLPLRFLQDVEVSSAAAADTLFLRFAAGAFTVRSRTETVDAQYGVPVEVAGVRFTLVRSPAENRAYLVVRPQEVAIDAVIKGIRAASRSGKRQSSAIIDISYTDTDADRAQRTVNALVHSFHRHNVRGVQERSRKRREFIEQLLAQSEADLARAEQALTSFRSAGLLYSSRDRLRSEQSSLMGLDVRRVELDSERRMHRALLERVLRSEVLSDDEVRTLISAPGITANSLVSTVFGQLFGYQTERERMLAGGKAASHPDVERLTSLITTTKSALIEAVQSHITSLDMRIASLDDLWSRSAGTIRELPAAETEEDRLNAEIDIVRRMTTTLRDEHQRARIAEAAEIGQVEILDLARFAAPVVTGNRTQKLVIGLMLGLLLGCGTALALEVGNSSIRRREELDGLLMVPGLGMIPRLDAGGRPKRPWLPVRLRERQGEGSSVSGQNDRLPVSDFRSAGAEAYRILRTNLLFSRPEERPKTLLVTSAFSGEGKTTTAANLAISLARQGMRVLLIDCDLRRPRLHQVFGIEQSPGFIDLLLGRAAAVDALRRTSVEKLYVLPRGAFDERAIEMLGGKRMKRFLEVFSRRFDFVLLDTSPVLVAADAATLGAMVDGVLLVVRAGRTQRDAARQTLQQLSTVGARVIGSVLNDPDAAAEPYEKYYYHQYYPVES